MTLPQRHVPYRSHHQVASLSRVSPHVFTRFMYLHFMSKIITWEESLHLKLNQINYILQI